MTVLVPPSSPMHHAGDEDNCDCEFDPYEPDDEDSWHYRRTCGACGEVWWALHCPHDGAQNPCPACGWCAPSSRTPMEILGLGRPHD